MFKFSMIVKDYYDQKSAGVNLVSESLTGLEHNSPENIVIRRETINQNQAGTYFFRVSDWYEEGMTANSIIMFCEQQPLYKDAYATPVPIKVAFGSTYLFSACNWAMYNIADELYEDIIFAEPIFPEGVTQVTLTVFIELKEIGSGMEGIEIAAMAEVSSGDPVDIGVVSGTSGVAVVTPR